VFLARFAQGKYGFQYLRYLKITFCIGWHSWDLVNEFREFLADLDNAVAGGLRFTCEGELEVVKELDEPGSLYEIDSRDVAENEPEDVSNRARLRGVEAILKRRIRFGCSKSNRGVVADPL
jgi:hypothetical protein